LWSASRINSWSSLFFLLYINDLPSIVTKENNIVLYADDASFVITNTDRVDFNIHINVLFNDINNWFESNLLNFNFNFTKTYYLEFSPSKRHNPHTLIHHNSKYVSNATQTNFLGLSLDDTLTWNYHTESLMRKMSAASYALRQIKYTLSTDSLKLIYFAHVQSIMNYSVIFWGNSPSAKKVFKLQKKIIRIVANIGMPDSCGEIFKNLQIMTLYSLYAYSIILFVVKNKHLFTVNNEIHKYNTRNNKNLHPAALLGNHGLCIAVCSFTLLMWWLWWVAKGYQFCIQFPLQVKISNLTHQVDVQT